MDDKKQIEELTEKNDTLIKNYAKCVKAYARGLFEELDEIMKEHKEGYFRDYRMLEQYAELRKKYIGDRPIRKEKRKIKRKCSENNRNCYNCNNCEYVGSSGYMCSINNKIVIEEWEPTNDYCSCKGKYFENV
jgi:hypothetical protein